jgi:hypothetical protein
MPLKNKQTEDNGDNSMSDPEKKAKKILDDWVASCRKNNLSGKVELFDVSNWAEKRLEINPKCPDLDNVDGVFILLCLGSLLSFGGGNYKARITELRNKYDKLIARDFDFNTIGKTSPPERKLRFSAIDNQVKELVKKYGDKDFLKSWWGSKKEEHGGDLEKSGLAISEEINGWKYNLRGKDKLLFTVKTFWVTRELHANGIWPDFPVKYCCIPDGYVKDVLCNLYGGARYKQLFGTDYKNPRFNLRSCTLMSQNVWELISKERVDGHYPYDMPFFRRGYLKSQGTDRYGYY